MKEKTCPAFGTPCIKEECIAYSPLQEEHYEPRLPWQERIIDYVVLGRCGLLNVEFRVYAEGNS